jgi:molybdopterin synthase sulfur carrier subunit
MRIDVTIPSLLRDCTGNETGFNLEAGTVAEALRVMLERYPLLRFHLYDDAEKLRPHVLIYHNDQNVAWLESLDVPLRAGDELTVLQNVSGG